jgi:signal transduction histidine kinase
MFVRHFHSRWSGPLLAGLLALPHSLGAAEPLASFAAVRALSQDEAATGVPVKVEGVVLGVDPASPWNLFMHDGTAGCYVKILPGTNAPGFVPGQRLLVNGASMKLGYYPNVGQARVRVLGKGVVPEPVRLTPDQIYSPDYDSAWVEVPAVVVGYEFKDQRLTLDVEVFGLPFKAELPLEARAEERVAGLLQRPLRLRGVLGTIFNQHRQMTDRHFFVPSLDAVIPTVAPVNGDTAPLIEVTQMLTGSYGPDAHIRIKGVVTQAAANGFNLRDATGSTFVHAARSSRFAPGAVVEVEGFGDIAPFRPVMRATRVTKLGDEAVPAPVAFDFHGPELPRMHAELITVEAEFVGRREGRFESILHCQSGQQVFEVLLPAGAELLRDLRPGDQLAVTGICELTTTHALPRISWVDGFRVHLAGAGGLRIVARAPWWTTQRLVVALMLMSAVALLGLAGTWILRRQVNKQMAIISENLRAEAVGKERDRMARDLHDTLEQQLSGVALQLDGLTDAIKTNPEAANKSLSLARRMLRFTRLEARRSVWDLRSKVLEQDGLVAALRVMAETATGPAGPVVEVNVSGEAHPLPTAVEFHLLRIAQEALANAIKHSEARKLIIGLEYATDATRLTVQDDGHGFNPEAREQSPGPHFGLLGMRERAAKIKAQLEVVSAPGAGCIISVTLPAEVPAPSA